MSNLATAPLQIGARALSLRTRRWMNDPRRHTCRQDRALRHLLAHLSRTRYGRDHGLEPEMSRAAFQAAAPIRGYEQLTDYIEPMKAGEPDQLWPGLCRYFAVSSGTTAGPSKFLPITDAMLTHFRNAGLESLLLFTARTRRTSIFGGKHLFLGGATALQRITPQGAPAVFAGDLSGITAAQLPWWAERMLYEPGKEIAHLDDWPKKIDSIVSRTRERDVRLVAGIPSWMLVLFEELRERAGGDGIGWRDLRSIWPNFECLVHGGVPVEPYVAQLRSFVGDAAFHEVFPASEGFIAAQDRGSGEGLRLLDNTGIFFEFVPREELGAEGLPRPGARALTISECQRGRDYALVLTTPAGLCRYFIGDLVRIVSTEPPRILYAGRTRLQLSAFGEHVIEHELTSVISSACRELDLEMAHFHVAPAFVSPESGRARGCHEWWIELAPTIRESRDVTNLRTHLDSGLQRLNDDYAAKRRGLGMDGPIIHIVRPGTFEVWLRSNGRWGGQNKVPRCRSDRAIADALERLHASNDR